MIKKVFRNRNDTWMAINLGVRLSTRMVTIGLLFKILSIREVTTWYVFITVFGLISLVEAGLGRVVTRQVADRFKANSCFEFKPPDQFVSGDHSEILLFYGNNPLINSLLFRTMVVKKHNQVENVPWLNIAWLFFVLANGIVYIPR